jgi:hypothetical protein
MEDLDGRIAVGVSFSDSQPSDIDGGQNVVAMDVHGVNTGTASGAGSWPVLDLPGTGTATRHSLMVAEAAGLRSAAIRMDVQSAAWNTAGSAEVASM